RADLPLDLVERVDARLGEEARERQARRRGRPRLRARLFGVDKRRYRGRATAFHGLLAGSCSLISSAILHESPSPMATHSAPECGPTKLDMDWRWLREAGRFLGVRLSATAHKYALALSVCQACKHHILCLPFRSVARCGCLLIL